MYRDLYNVLGVPRTATPDEIKRAYRTLAQRWHPDKNPDDPDAARRFKDLSEAYRTLSDPDRRARYDRLGPLYTSDGRPPTPEDLGEVMGTVWGNLFGRRDDKRPGEDLRYTLSLPLEEVAQGVERTITVARQVRCRSCAGEGSTSTERQTCPVCAGNGRSPTGRLFRTQCYHCEGRGYTVSAPCATCGGEGRHGTEEQISVRVPAGVATGQKLKVRAKGNSPRGRGPDGDLYVVISVPDHPLFRRRGEDLLTEVPISMIDAALGADIPVPTLDGRTTIRVPKGTPSGKVFRMAGRGLPRMGGNGRGDLHLQVNIETPTALTPEAERALAGWAAQLPDDAHPERAAWRRTVLER